MGTHRVAKIEARKVAKAHGAAVESLVRQTCEKSGLGVGDLMLVEERDPENPLRLRYYVRPKYSAPPPPWSLVLEDDGTASLYSGDRAGAVLLGLPLGLAAALLRAGQRWEQRRQRRWWQLWKRRAG